MIRTGIIGFGLAGRNQHYRTIAEKMKDIAKVSAIFSRHKIKNEVRDDIDLPLNNDIGIFDDIEDFFKNGNFDVVHITVPSGLHLKYIEIAARYGKHIICEKPIEVTLEKTDRAIKAASNANVGLSVCFQNRYNPDVQKIKKVISEGCLGKILNISLSCLLYRDSSYYTESFWHGTLEMDGGAALMNQGIHYVDLFQWLADESVVEIKRGITERINHSYIEAEDFAYGEMVLGNGANVTILCGTCFKPGIGQTIEFTGTDGQIIFRDGHVIRAFWNGEDRSSIFRPLNDDKDSVSSPILGLENHTVFFNEVYNDILCGRTPPVSGTEARKSLEIILGLYKAAETGSTVIFPLETGYKPSFGKNK